MQAPALDPHAKHAPSTRFLSNGAYRALVTAAGTGGSWFREHALTRWVGDRVQDCHAFSIYWCDLQSGAFGSIGHQPTRHPAERYGVTWVPGRLRIGREDDGLALQLDIAVAPQAALEMRRLAVTNRSRRPRRVELTSYAEVVLALPAAHAAHPVFSKLFVQTEVVDGALLARRRPRAPDEEHPWLVHGLSGASVVGHETDRTRFIGRGGSLASPHVLRAGLELSGTCGNVLDPIVSLRCVLDLEPDETRTITFLLGAAEDRDGALQLLADHGGDSAVEAAFAAATAAATAVLVRIGLDPAVAATAHALAGAILYGHPGLRGDAPSRHARDVVGAAGVEPSIPGSLRHPYVVLHAASAGANVVNSLAHMHSLWCELGLGIDVVCIGGRPRTSRPAPQPWAGSWHDAARLSDPALARLEAGASLVVRQSLPHFPTHAERPPVSAFVPHAHPGPGVAKAPTAGASLTMSTATAASTPPPPARATPTPRAALECDNGYGAFADAGREYVLRLRGEAGLLHGLPPQPWTNVIANEDFGFLISETGARHTWSRNSREHRLTPWCNDPLLDPHEEALYLRDEASGDFWSPLPGPCPADGEYEVRHGFGVTSFRHQSHDIVQEVQIFVPRHDLVQIALVRLTNAGQDARRLSLFAYQRLVLGDLPETSAATILCERDAETGALLARQTAAGAVGDLAFAACIPTAAAHFTCDRAAFIGRNGTAARPAALCEGGGLEDRPAADLGNRPAADPGHRTGADIDACFVQQVVVELPAAATRCIGLLFGAAPDVAAMQAMLARFETIEAVEKALRAVRAFWHDSFARVRIATPSRPLDLLANGWLPYQTLACRLWARTAFYQSGGAFGYRDQLQDAAALVALWPERTRAQILLHAARQFVEGDVLHWWHPPHDRGIRTRFADDLLWLPYVTAAYVQTTGDWSVLDEHLPYLRARPLAPGEDEAYLLPQRADAAGSLYEHCCRALDRSLALGAHGLPLFGTGDWNDGMNRVGREGRGESVWMGFFLHAVLGDFLPVCARRDDRARSRRYEAHREALRQGLETAGWDGDWYRRGYYDSGAPLGSRQSDECRIDALVQAWAVLSGAAPAERAARAIQAVEAQLVSERDGIVRLLTPPFSDTPEDPGYIKGYVPGVRENGGQYTHAALWFVRALAALGRNDRVAPLLEMLAPMHQTRDAAAVARYRVEPYVVAADVYGAPPHVGRGGWTWYTGSAGWMYRVILESLLGFGIRDGDTLELDPCVPDDWSEFRIDYTWPGEATGTTTGESTRWRIRARNPHRRGRGVRSASLDGAPVPVASGVAHIPVCHDGRPHDVDVVLGREGGARP